MSGAEFDANKETVGCDGFIDLHFSEPEFSKEVYQQLRKRDRATVDSR